MTVLAVFSLNVVSHFHVLGGKNLKKQSVAMALINDQYNVETQCIASLQAFTIEVKNRNKTVIARTSSVAICRIELNKNPF